MIDFPDTHREDTAKMPAAFFSTHMLALGDDPAAGAERQKCTATARALVAPVDEAFFAGMIDPARLDRLAVRLVKSPVGDRRDWPRIEAWADGLVSRVGA